MLNPVPALGLVLLAASGCGTAGRDVDPRAVFEHGGVVRGDTLRPEIALVFTGDAYADGGWHIRETLREAEDELLINSLSMMLDFDSEDKQALLEAPSLSTRRETLVTLIEYALRGGESDEVMQ